jgi:hypothetical protein
MRGLRPQRSEFCGGEAKMEVFDIKALRTCLNTGVIGKELRYWPEVDSTNAMALRLAPEGAVEGTVVVAETQSKGRARAGKP